MAILKARDIAALDTDSLWALPDGPLKIEFDDGVVETNARATILSAYIFGPFYRRYPNCPARSSHHLGQRQLGTQIILDLIGEVLFDTRDVYPEEDIEDMMLLATQLNNKIYNDFTYKLEAYVGSVSILDFIEVIDHPDIAKANSEVEPNETSVNKTYDVIKKTLNTSRDLRDNIISRVARNSLVSMGQILQVVGPRGRCTDIDSNIFRLPVLSGYVHGIQTLAESMIESRSAAKALSFTKDPLKDSQYTNRKIQLMAESLMHLWPGDCGGGRLIPVRLRGRDFELFAGKYYLREGEAANPANYKILKASDKHLAGELIYVRTIFDCRHPDPQGVCSACYGSLAWSIPKGTNIGHIAATVLCESISQILLSTKHLDTSAASSGTILSDYDGIYLEENTETNTLRLSDRLAKANIALIMQAKEANHINDVTIVDDVSRLSPSNISNLTDIKLEIETAKVKETVALHVSDEARKSYMSTELLDHVKRVGWSLTATGDYRVDLKEWDPAAPLLELPMKQSSMLDYMFTIERFLRASDKGKTAPTLKTYSSPEGGLMKLYELVSSRLKFNIVHMECLVKACMVRSISHMDYRIPIAGNATEFGRYGKIMEMRSLGAAMAFEFHSKILLSPYAFVVTKRPDHPLDALIRG